jgi:hypothetical protein
LTGISFGAALVLDLAAVLVHEASHAAAARWLGYRPHPFVGLRPPRIGVKIEGAVHPAADALIALAGPAGNLAAALLLVSVQQRTAALVFALLGVASLLPWPARNDGAHALAAVRQHRIGAPPRSRR